MSPESKATSSFWDGVALIDGVKIPSESFSAIGLFAFEIDAKANAVNPRVTAQINAVSFPFFFIRYSLKTVTFLNNDKDKKRKFIYRQILTRKMPFVNI